MRHIRIETRDLVFAYGATPILNGISLSVEAGELFAIVGPSGAGKTTLLRILSGLEQPTGGTVLINGMAVNTADQPAPPSPRERAIGMVFQDFSLWPHLSVYENVVFGVARAALKDGTAAARAEEILKTLGIFDTRHARPDQLSGGQRQRAALARALMGEPRLLLLDDPFSNLEHELRLQMRRDLRTLQRTLALTTVFVTHDLEDAFSIADRVAVIGRGTLRQIGTPTALYDFPNTVDVARFVGIDNFIHGTLSAIDRQQLEFISDDFGALRWSMREPPQPGPAILSLRPNALQLCPIDSFRDGRYAWVEGRIVASEFLGENVRYQVAVGASVLSAKLPHILGAPVTPSGMPVLIGFDPTHARIFPASGV